MTPTPPPPTPSPARYRLLLPALVAALVGLVSGRAVTRRPDDARLPRRPDVLVLHLAGLRADALDVPALAGVLGVPGEELVRFENAWASGNDGLRSALSALTGDLATDLGAAPPDGGLPAELRAGGYRTLLLDEGDALRARAALGFDAAPAVAGVDGLAPALSTYWASAGGAPRFTWVEVSFGDDPLHADTTEAWMLDERYELRRRALRNVATNCVRAATAEGRATILVLLGSTGLELGEHPDEPALPWDPQIRVPFVLALRGGKGLPGGGHRWLVSDVDLAPTLLDLLDLPRPSREGSGRSLEALVHGWSAEPPHEAVFSMAAGHVVARSGRWKLIAPWSETEGVILQGARLYAVEEDPEERRNLLGADARPGPVAQALFSELAQRFPPAKAP